jgi:hypothetical protein
LTNTITYSILKYSHSKLLGEEINLGILFVFPELELVEFYYPRSLSRLTKTYPDISEKLVRSYLESFKYSSKKLGKLLSRYHFDLNELLDDFFLIQDSSSLQFTKFNHALCLDDVNSVKQQYINLFLSAYNQNTEHSTKKITDKEISNACKNRILQLQPAISDHLKSANLIFSHNHINFKTDFCWQNGTTNYVKGLSFDLEKEDKIIEKSLLIEIQLKYLKKNISDSKARIDLLVHPPQSNKFQDTFLEALDILNNAEANKSIFIGDGLDNYASKVVDEIEL